MTTGLFFKTIITTAFFALIWAETASADTLKDALASAYNKNPRLQAERARLRETDEGYIQARAQSRPSVALSGVVSGSAVRTPFSFGSLGADNSSVTVTGTPAAAQLEIIQPVYQGGRLKAQRAQAHASILAAREGLKNSEQQIFLSAATAYIDVLRDEQTAAFRRRNFMALSRQLEAAQISFDVGAGTRTDIAQAQGRVAGAEIGLAAADAGLESSRAVFRRIVGRNAVDLQPIPQIIIPSSREEALNIALRNNPQINAARLNYDASDYGIDIAKSLKKPSLSLNATAAAQREQILGFSQADALTISAQVRVPLFSGGGNKSRVRQAQHAKTRLGFEVRDAELQVTQMIEQAWAQIQAAQRSFTAGQSQVQATRIAFEGVELEQHVGTRTVLDVLDAEAEVLNAEINLLAAQRNLDGAIFQLLAVMGTFNVEGLGVPVDVYVPADNLEAIKADGFDRLSKTVLSGFEGDK